MKVLAHNFIDYGEVTKISKKNIEKITTYAKIEDYDQKIINNEAFRSGWVEVLGDEMSYYLDDTYDPEVGTDVWVFPTEEHEFLDGVAGFIELNQNDRIHPNPEGVKIITEKMSASITEALK